MSSRALFSVLLLLSSISLPVSADTFSAIKPKAKSPAAIEYDKGLAAVDRDPKAARAAFEKCVELEPRQPACHLWLGEIALRLGQPKLAEPQFQKALAAAPGSLDVLLAWAHFLNTQGRVAECENTLKKAADLDPRSVRPRLEMGDLYLLRLDRPKEAASAYRSAIALDATNPVARLGLARALALSGDTDAANRELDEAARLAPKDPHVPTARGNILLINRQLDQAMAQYQAAIKLAPTFGEAYTRVGDVEQMRGNKEKAEQAYRRAIELDPRQAAAFNNLAYAYAETKRELDQALVWAKRAVALAPNDAGYLDTLGWVYRARGALTDARRVLQKASNSKPPVAEIYYHLGVVCDEAGHPAEAEAALKKALALKQDFPGAADARARLSAARAPQSSGKRK